MGKHSNLDEIAVNFYAMSKRTRNLYNKPLFEEIGKYLKQEKLRKALEITGVKPSHVEFQLPELSEEYKKRKLKHGINKGKTDKPNLHFKGVLFATLDYMTSKDGVTYGIRGRDKRNKNKVIGLAAKGRTFIYLSKKDLEVIHDLIDDHLEASGLF